jgi:hypothetical protein
VFRPTRIALLAALAAVAALAAAPALALPRALTDRFFGPAMVRAEIIFKDSAGVHDYRVDRGRVRAASAESITLVERDGTVVTVPLSPTTDVRWNGRPVHPARLAGRGAWAETIREGEGPARAVRASGLARNLALSRAFYGPQMVRAQVILKDGTGLHDYRIDRGRIRSVSANAISLLERDGTLTTIPVAGNADVRLNGRRVRLQRLRRGMNVETVRDGEAPAFIVHAVARS